MARHLTDFEKARTREWLIAQRGATPMGALVDDMNRELAPWSIDRTRYGRYENGTLDIGPRVFKALVAYWTGKGKDGPDFTPPVPTLPVLSLEERAILAAERQADAAEEANRLQAEQNDLLRLMLLRDQLPEDHWDEMRARGLEWTDAAVARLLTPPTHDPRPSPVG